MADPTFVTNRLAELPPVMNGPQGRAWATGMGTVQDAQVAVARVAALSRWPYYCPDDALDAVGGWMLLQRFPGEPNGTAPPAVGQPGGSGYRGRLCAAFPTWIAAGSKQAIITSFNGYGLPDVEVQNDYEASPPFPGAWWSRFRVVVGPSFGAYGWGPGNDPTVDQQNALIRQVLQWKWAYSYPVEIVLDDGMGYIFPITVGPILGYNFVWAVSHFGGYQTL